MIVFDLTDENSFRDATGYWLPEVNNVCNPGSQILLVGNKNDLAEQRKVKEEDIQVFMKQNPEVKYIETSAKTSENVHQAF